MQTGNTLHPEEIIKIILKRRWFVIIPFCVAVIIGISLAVTLPKKYASSTVIMVQAQRVPSEYVQSVITTDITSRLNTIAQQVLSRTNIERVIETYKLFQGPGYDGMYLEDKVTAVRSRIDINTKKSDNGKEVNTFSITYKGENPQQVRDIANALATYFVNENYKVREAQATGTSDFLNGQLESMRRALEKSEETYREYRQKYMGELPEQLEPNLQILSRLNEQLLDKQKNLQELAGTITILEGQVSEAQRNAKSAALAKNTGTTDASDLPSLKAQLEGLQARYKENHPSVVRLKTMIANMEKTGSEGTGAAPPGGVAGSVTSPQEIQVAGLRMRARVVEGEIAELKQKIDSYQVRVENTPKREEELYSIKRDYENLKTAYDSLDKRRIEADISVNMEKKQKGEQFQIIDPAVVPEKPTSPDMLRLFLITIALGLGIGGVAVYLMEFSNQSFKSVEDVESSLGITVLATIPVIHHPKDLLRTRLNNICTYAALGVSLALLAGFAFLTLRA